MGKIKKGTMKRRRVVVLILIGSLVLLSGGAAWWYFMQSKTPANTATQQVTEMSDIVAIEAEGRRAIEGSNIKAGEDHYDAALKAAQNDDVTLQLLLSKVNFYLQANEADRAIAVAKEAEAKFPDAIAVYIALARAYEAKGAKQEAAAEYRRALAALGDEAAADPSKPAANRTNMRAYYESRIQELEK